MHDFCGSTHSNEDDNNDDDDDDGDDDSDDDNDDDNDDNDNDDEKRLIVQGRACYLSRPHSGPPSFISLNVLVEN